MAIARRQLDRVSRTITVPELDCRDWRRKPHYRPSERATHKSTIRMEMNGKAGSWPIQWWPLWLPPSSAARQKAYFMCLFRLKPNGSLRVGQLTTAQAGRPGISAGCCSAYYPTELLSGQRVRCLHFHASIGSRSALRVIEARSVQAIVPHFPNDAWPSIEAMMVA